MTRQGEGKVGVDLGLSTEDKEVLRNIALQAIRSRCLGQPMADVPVQGAKLIEKRGAFVCLHLEGRLRGCIGTIEPREPLHVIIRNMAIQAAFGDPRFSPLDACEVDRIDLEISVLTPLSRITDPDQIRIGTHGLFLRKGLHSGLLLPQVATEHGWDRKTFLEWTSRKAGLDARAWKEPDAEIYIFSADIF